MKDYKEILEGVVNIINTTEKCDTGFVNICSYIGENCPEFKESEDERIRKKLIEAVKGDMVVGGTKDKQLAIAWLEKQGKKSVDKLKVSNELYEHIRNTYTCIYNAVRPNTFTDMTNYLLTAARSAQSALDMIENQGETKLLDYDDFGFKPATEATKGEKVDSQNCVKSVDKVEHKFEVGNWITFYGGKPFKILDIKREENGSLDYLLLNQDGHNSYYNKKYVDTNAKLWTIEDAKAGDVIAADGYIILFKELLSRNGGVSYCHYDYVCTNLQFNFNEDNNWYFDRESGEIHPATKEECDTLFKAMKEAGYVWLPNKKQLVKLLFKEGDTVRKKSDGSIWHINYINERSYWDNHKPIFPIENQNEFELIKPELTPSETTKENSELTEFEKAVNNLLWRNIERPSKFQSKPIKFTKNEASELLSIARKQVIDEAESWLRDRLINKYKDGILQCLRDDRAAFILDDFRKDLGKG